MPLFTKRSLASATNRFLSCSEITKSKASSIASVSVPACNAFCARLIFAESKRKCLCDRALAVDILILLLSKYSRVNVHIIILYVYDHFCSSVTLNRSGPAEAGGGGGDRTLHSLSQVLGCQKHSTTALLLNGVKSR